MDYREDVDDFTGPFDAERARVIKALKEPLATSGDADAILARRYADKEALNAFTEALAQRQDRGTFWGLPGIQTGTLSRSTRYKILEKGPYRGIFLVDRASNTAVGLIFSKAPHDLHDRIPQVGARWSQRRDHQGKIE